MEKIKSRKKAKVRQTVYFSPSFARRLKQERGNTDKHLGAIIEEIVARHFELTPPLAPDLNRSA